MNTSDTGGLPDGIRELDPTEYETDVPGMVSAVFVCDRRLSEAQEKAFTENMWKQFLHKKCAGGIG